MITKGNKCPSCGKNQHDFVNEEILNCVPPRDVLIFGQNEINREYREVLFKKFPNYTVEEILGSFFGENPYFPSQNDWLYQQEEA